MDNVASILIIGAFAAILGYSPIDCHSQPDKSGYDSQDVKMVMLKIDLQDGFINDMVNIRINGEEVFNKHGVKTRFQIGYAESFEVKVEQGLLNVEVTLPLKNISESAAFEISNDMYLGISVTPENTISIRPSIKAFGYL